ncbi:DNA topoisomerase 2 isoform X2 [Cylas formicarius]|uniref:DNA topoisomerase 2 isoform X2 n=1 Tax=Cylas formicarius TaxID=197179 RepID=UPI00295889AE|nr:DNA topoisomerase 2 isoform X2 [Cylas formicarius]
MADLKTKSSNATNGDGAAGDGQPVGKPPPPRKATIEKTYQKKSQLEHILLRPDTYIGSVEKVKESMWLYDPQKNMMAQREIEYVPGLYKIFDEILVNAADNKQRDKKMDCIKVEIRQAENEISVWNNGQGIPVVMHKDEKMFVPTMIFGHLLTSSNYNDEEEKVTGGRNGYGAKLCNIFSERFVVETASKEYKRQFKQTWAANMTKTAEPKVKDFFGDDFTKITFSPDLSKFKMERLDDDIVALMSRRAYDIAASTRGVKVFLNGQRLPIKGFKDYVDLFLKDREDETGNNLKVVYEAANERWEVAMTVSDHGFQQMSFVNSIATTKGGRHVDYVVDMIVKQLQEVLKKKNKGGPAIKGFQVRNHLWVFVNCLIVNPTFDSQTKENMTLQMKNFGSKCVLSEKFVTQMTKCGIVETVLSWAKFKAQNDLVKASAGRKQIKLKGVPKLEDANEAGTKNGLRCTLILTEGDSAKSLAVSGLSVIGRDYYGVFPLRGKLLNVREATHKQILENAEINNLVKIIGLQYKRKYNTPEDMKTLRYGKVMIMTDQDQDGSHIKGLVINFIHYNWPELLRQNFLEEFITPIVKATKKGAELSFYSLPEFEEWKSATPNHHTYRVKYYKGLGTSTSKEAKEYFTNMERHRIQFRYNGQEDDDHIVLAFSRKHIEQRKEWLTNFMTESKQRKELGMPDKYLYGKHTKFVSFKDFVNLELVLFSNADNVRSIPSMVDGMKPGQRKVLFTCFKRNDKREVKVAQLAGSVAEHSAYHHGEVSLCMTIVNLAQNYVGSNNINLLEPRGQFGTRLAGGKDSASPRYIFTKMSPLTRMIFHPNDDALLKYEYDDNQKIEPQWYIPIVPMVLVNGADGIGTGWMTKIPNYNPRDIARCLYAMLDGAEPGNLAPWYKNFKGTIESVGDNRYMISGEIGILDDNRLEISELPVGTWTQNYKESVLEPMLYGNDKVKASLSDYKEYNTDTTVRFVVTLLDGQMENMQKEGLHKVFKLQSLTSLSSMCAFDADACLRRYDSVMEILREFYALRLKMYQLRKQYLEGKLDAETRKLSNQARFILEKCNGKLVVENKGRAVIVAELVDAGYEPDPVKMWQRAQGAEDEQEMEKAAEDDENNESDEVDERSGFPKKVFDPARFDEQSTDVKNFDYLLGMTIWMLTEEKKKELLRQRDVKMDELRALQKKTSAEMWRDDLAVFLKKLDEVEQKERLDEQQNTKQEKVKADSAAGHRGRRRLQGKKKMLDTKPSTTAIRVVPEITEEIKKKVQAAMKIQENKSKKIKKEVVNGEEESGEGDEAVKGPKGKKGGGGKVKKDAGSPRQKQAKPANGKKAPRGKKKITSSDDESSRSDSDMEVAASKASTSQPVRTNARRAATKQMNYSFSDEDEDAMSDADDDVLFDNEGVRENSGPAVVRLVSDESDNDDHIKRPAPDRKSSEDLFDDLVGGVKAEDAPPKKNAFDELLGARKKQTKRKSTEEVASDSEEDMFAPKKGKKAAKTKPPAKKKEAETVAKAPRPKKKKKNAMSDDDDDFEPEVVGETMKRTEAAAPRSGRGAAKAKYIFSDDESE